MTAAAFADLPVETIELALSHLDANCDRDTWARIGMALKSELGEPGFDVWDAWSRRADNYDQRDARDTWRSIRATGGVTIATLIHMAKENGYRPDSQPRQIDPAAAAARRAQGPA
jgi:putative DNA primase/helicase